MRDECSLRACRLPCTPLRAVGPLLGILLARLEQNWLERFERLLLTIVVADRRLRPPPRQKVSIRALPAQSQGAGLGSASRTGSAALRGYESGAAS